MNFVKSDEKITPMERASAAKQVLNNPIFMEAVEEIRKEVMNLWSKTGVNQIEERESCYALSKALGHVVSRLEGYINEAVLEERMREEREKVGK